MAPTEEKTCTKRRTHPLSASRPASVFSQFCVGLICGLPGGLLLGRTSTVLLRSLERLAENKKLMYQLENYIIDTDVMHRPGRHRRPGTDRVSNMYISVLAEHFGVHASAFSLTAGILIGLFVYKLVMKNRGDSATRKALALAALGCLMGVTVTGYVLSFAFQNFLFITSSLGFGLSFLISILLSLGVVLLSVCVGFCCDEKVAFIVCCLTPLNTPFIVLFASLLGFILKTKLILLIALIPIFVFGILIKDRYEFQPSTAPIPLMLIITDVFNIARQPIVTLRLPTHTGQAVVEGLFIGVFTPQMLMVSIGMLLFVSWQRGAAGRICVGAAACGAAVLAVVGFVLPAPGPVATAGALLGVSGALGVSISAAVVATRQYGPVGGNELVGGLGVSAGAGVAAFLLSSSHGGVSGIFMGLCGVSVPAGFYLNPMYLLLPRHGQGWSFSLFLVMTVLLSIWLYFTCTISGAIFLALLCFVVWIATAFSLCLNWDSEE